MLRWHVISAVFWRNVKQFFSSIQGYLFIVVFVTFCAVLTFSPQFFADNLATLDKLTQWFPLLLLFLIPGITMGIWADEQRQGTDAILFTLPASNFEIMLGKYLSVATVYTVALIFSMTQLIAMAWIGDPDWGVIASTYVGYWLAGLALCSVGMFASSLTKSPALAFVLGDVFCAIPVTIGYYFRGFVSIERWGFDWNLSEFAVGLLPLSNILYFVALIVFMLYLNLIVISKRLWSGEDHVVLGGQFGLRASGLLVGLISLVLISDTASTFYRTQVDLTKEKLYTLDPTTVATLDEVREMDKNVKIQAFVSDQVPRKYVNTKKRLTGLLRQLDVNGGNFVDVEFVEVAPNSPQEKAAKQLGMEPVDDSSEVGGRLVSQRVYLGCRISTAESEKVLPMLDSDSALEYELTRAIALTSDKSKQKTLAILDTDAHFGGPEFEGRRIDWAYAKTLAQLKKQYEIKYIDQSEMGDYIAQEKQIDESQSKEDGAQSESDGDKPKTEIVPPLKEAPDILLVADPSSLTAEATRQLVLYLESGNPAIILLDPLPFFFTSQQPQEIGVLNAPRQPRVSMRSPYQQVLTSASAPKADNGQATQLLAALGIEWDNGAAAWGLDNPHTNFSGAWFKEFLGDTWPDLYGPFDKAFVWARNHGESTVLNEEHPVSSGLNELLFIYPGAINPVDDAKTEFIPLVTLAEKSGITPWEELTLTPKSQVRQRDSLGRITFKETAARSRITMDDLVVVNPNPATLLDDKRHVLAAQIKSGTLNTIVIADLDFVSDFFHDQQDALGSPLDNVRLLENSIEVLLGETGFVSLRNRRATPRTLTKMEEWTNVLKAATVEAKQAAEKKSRDALAAEQKRLEEQMAKISKNEELSLSERLQRTFSSASDSQRKFELRKMAIDRELEEDLELLKTEEQQKVKTLVDYVQRNAILLAPLPALLLGIFVLSIRTINERRHISDKRRV